MNQNSSTQSVTEECCVLIAKSNTLYSRMLENLELLCNTPEPGTHTQLLKRNQDFLELQATIKSHDEQLHTMLIQIATPDSRMSKLLNTRKELIQKVWTQNKKTTSRLESVKALLGSEIKKFRSGHKALQGYQSNENSQSSKNILKTAY